MLSLLGHKCNLGFRWLAQKGNNIGDLLRAQRGSESSRHQRYVAQSPDACAFAQQRALGSTWQSHGNTGWRFGCNHSKQRLPSPGFGQHRFVARTCRFRWKKNITHDHLRCALKLGIQIGTNSCTDAFRPMAGGANGGEKGAAFIYIWLFLKSLGHFRYAFFHKRQLFKRRC